MYRLFLIFLLSGALCGLSARALSVTAKVIGTGIDAKGNQLCEVQAEVKNPSDMAVTVIMMSCGWCESWSVIPTDIFEVYGWECAKNVAGRYDFVAGGGFVFRFWIVAPASAGKIEGKKIKLGFRFAQEPKRMPGIAFRPSREVIGQAPLVWSEEVTVPRIEQKPVTLPWQGTRTAAAKL